ncbi:MAG: YihY/virulence factor BrkB family protein, partial [Myxococcota bacterium]
MGEKAKAVARLIWTTIENYMEDKGPQLAAALAFYTLFSAAPLVIIATALTGIVFGREVAQDEVLNYLEGFGGQETRQYLLELIERWQDTSSGVIATIIGVAALLYGAYRVFGALRDALNAIFNVRPRKDLGWKQRILNEAFPFSMILFVGALLFSSLLVSTAIAAIARFFEQAVATPIGIWSAVNLGVSFAMTTVLFAVLVRWLPDVEIEWKDIFFGAALTSLAFNLGKSLIALYLAKSGMTSVFGAAGALVVLLFWVYYSAQIFFLGAEFTQAYAEKYGGGVNP